MKELDNKGINISGFRGFGLSKHKIQWFQCVSNLVQCLIFSLYVFVEEYRIFEIRIWVHNNQWSGKNQVYDSRSITEIKV